MWGLSSPTVCGVLVPRPGIEPASPALEDGFLTTGPLKEVPAYFSKYLFPVRDGFVFVFIFVLSFWFTVISPAPRTVSGTW